MTIHDFVNARKLRHTEIPEYFPLGKLDYFPGIHTDLLQSEDGRIFVAINRVNHRFAADNNGVSVLGFDDVDLSDEQLSLLSIPK